MLQRTFYRALSSVDSAVFKCIDFVLLTNRCIKGDDPEISFLAECIAAVAIKRLGNRTSDDRRSDIRGLNWSQCDSFKLRNLVQIARELDSAQPDYDDPSARATTHNRLCAVHLKVANPYHEAQHKFCELWIQLVT